jgi:hypothetical protein
MVAPFGTILFDGLIMDHIEGRIRNFIKYRPGVQISTFGEFIDTAPHNPEKYRQGFWAVNCSLDQLPYITLVEVIAKYNLQSNCVFLVSDYDNVEKYRHLNFRYFPYFIAEGIAQIKDQNDLENPVINFDYRTNQLSCVNRFARFHRLYTFYRIHQQPNLKDIKLSFTRLETLFPDENGLLHPTDLTLDQLLDVARLHHFYTEDFELWLRDEFPHLPRQIEEQDNRDNKYDNWVKSVAFSETYANIVTETYVEDFLPTEKVVKPLLAGCLFMPISSQYYMKKLERMGFDLQFEGIDYNLYDNLPTWQERADCVVVLANELYPNIEDIWRANIGRLKHNRNLFFSKALEDHIIQDLADVFELNTG